MSSIREAVARAIGATIKYPHIPDNAQHLLAAATITAFLKAAAEQGWHMRPDEATEAMALQGARDIGKTIRIEKKHIERSKSCHRVMNQAAPEFEWDK